jgi:hypothetical protein
MNKHILPDSRAKNVTVGSKIVDWPLPDGTTVRLEAVLIYCASCGKEYGYVPHENTVFAFYLCNKCFENYGKIAGTYAVPEEEFCKAVEHEVMERFGRNNLTEQDILNIISGNNLGSALAALARESPFPVKK